MNIIKPGIERLQALADTSRSGYVVIAPNANPPNSAQLEGTSDHSPSYTRVGAVVWECGETQTRVTNIHFASSSTHAICKKTWLRSRAM